MQYMIAIVGLNQDQLDWLHNSCGVTWDISVVLCCMTTCSISEPYCAVLIVCAVISKMPTGLVVLTRVCVCNQSVVYS